MDAANSSPQQNWRGCSMDEIHHFINEFELDHVEPVRLGGNNIVLYHFPIREPENKPPRPLKAHEKWDSLHVRLPCSPKSQYPVTADDGSSSIESRWEMIEQALLQPITDSRQLQAAILSYNSRYENQWNFRALHKLFDNEYDESEKQIFFDDLLPRIIRLALRLPELVQAPIPLLKQGQNHSISLTQEQVACLLANAFLCTYPRRNTLKRKSEYSTFPDINFNRLFQSSGQSVLEKIKCICHYFRRVCPTERDNSNVPTGVLTFTRRSLPASDMPHWKECEAPIGGTPLHITSSGTIEDQGVGLLQVDFANKFLGGGVLGSGCVQEEIRFVICPELLISKLFTESLRPTEALLIIGCERYSNYTGYASTFKWAGNFDDNTPPDGSRRRMTHIVAIDALAFSQSGHQYREELMLRELNKAYVGFIHPLVTPAPGVASGNWGCGAFGGDAALKALLQLMVCTMTGRPLVYYTFGNDELRDEVHRMHTFCIEQNILVKDMWAILKKFQGQRLAPNELYSFIYRTQLGKDERRQSSQNQRPKNSVKKNKNRILAPSKSSLATSTVVKANQSQSTNEMSASEAENELDASINSTTRTSSLPATLTSMQYEMSDESVDALLLDAGSQIDEQNALSNCDANKPNTPTTPKSPQGNRTRQLSLLDMLNQAYNNGQSNNVEKSPSKRGRFDDSKI